MSTDLGFQTLISVGADVAAVTATVPLGGLSGITMPSLSRDEFDKTAMNDPNYLRSFGPGLSDPGELQLDLNWLPDSATEAELREMFAERAGRLIQVRFNMVTPNVTCTFRAFLKERSPVVPMDEKMTASCVFRLETAMTWGTAV